MKNIKILIKNILNILLLLFVLNLTIVFSYSIIYIPLKNLNVSDPPRSQLDVYLPHSWALNHFKEFSEMETTYTSYLGYKRKPFKGSTINIDEKGVRNTLNQGIGNEKVFFYGGSTIWGTGVPDSLTIPSIFNKFSDFKYNVTNYGESGYHSFLEYLKYLIHIQKDKLSPDIVIFYDGVNEFNFLEKGNDYIYSNPVESMYKTSFDLTSSIKNQTNNLLEYFKGIFFNPLSKVISRLSKKSEIDIEYNINRSENIIKDAADNSIQNWVLSKNLSERNNIKPYFILQPNLHTSIYNDKYIPLNKDRDSVYKKYYYYLKEGLKKQNFEFYDLIDIFENENDIYIDYCHLTPKGNKIISKKIFEIINKQ